MTTTETTTTKKKIPTVAKVQEMIDDSFNESIKNTTHYSWIKNITFEKIDFPAQLPYGRICYGNGKYVCLKENCIYFSENLTTWTEIGVEISKYSADPTLYHMNICYGNNIFVISGNDNYISYSNDLINWTKKDVNYYTNGNTTLAGWLCYGNNKFILQSHFSRTIAKSPDGINWFSDLSIYANVVDLCYGNHKFVMLSTMWIYYSDTGEGYFNKILTNFTNAQYITYGNNMFIILCSDRTILTSHDAITWSGPFTTNLPVEHCWKFTYSYGVFIAIFSNSTFYSFDGKYWIQFQLPDCSGLVDACFGPDRLVIISSDSKIYVSNYLDFGSVINKDKENSDISTYYTIDKLTPTASKSYGTIYDIEGGTEQSTYTINETSITFDLLVERISTQPRAIEIRAGDKCVYYSSINAPSWKFNSDYKHQYSTAPCTFDLSNIKITGITKDTELKLWIEQDNYFYELTTLPIKKHNEITDDLSISGNLTVNGNLISQVIVDIVYPVGSIYITIDKTKTPETLFPGTTWEQIKDRYLYCSDSPDNLGGSTFNVPSHSHQLKGLTWDYGIPGSGSKYINVELKDGGGTLSKYIHTYLNDYGRTEAYGDVYGYKPPYYSVLAYKRTA